MILYNLLIALAVSFSATALIGVFLVKKLRKLKAGQSIYKEGPSWHMSKQGTPTMGGLMFIAGIGLTILILDFGDIAKGELGAVYVFLFAVIYGLIGFLDDYEKLKKKRNLGLTARQKFLLQLVVALAFILLLRYAGYVKTNLYIPFWNKTVQVNEVVYLVFAVFVIVGTVNAVNLTDGIDGLAAGVSLPVALCYASIAAMWGASMRPFGIFAAALAGGLTAFLIFNFHPAKVFMGDTGSLFLGGAVCALAFAMDMPLILIPLGIIYIIETLSDILQITYFKLTHGKRIFKMAPLHHHFEMCGWSEIKIFTVFTLISAAFAVLSWYAVSGRYVI